MAHTDAQNRQSSFYEEVVGVDVYTIYRTNALWCATVRTDGRAPVDRTMLQRTKELASNMCLSMTLPRSGARKPSASTLQYVLLLQFLQLSLTHSGWAHGRGCHMLTVAIQYGKRRNLASCGLVRVITPTSATSTHGRYCGKRHNAVDRSARRGAPLVRRHPTPQRNTIKNGAEKR